jgi:hypothetical protein
MKMKPLKSDMLHICFIILHFDFDCSNVEDEELIALTLSTGHVRERKHFVDVVCFDPPLATFLSSCSSLFFFSLPPPFPFLIFGLPFAQHDIPLVVFVLLLNVLEDDLDMLWETVLVLLSD